MSDDVAIRVEQADLGDIDLGQPELATSFSEEVLRLEQRGCSELLVPHERDRRRINCCGLAIDFSHQWPDAVS
jgi:hypothetical protein